jgi:hypothetical protein
MLHATTTQRVLNIKLAVFLNKRHNQQNIRNKILIKHHKFKKVISFSMTKRNNLFSKAPVI